MKRRMLLLIGISVVLLAILRAPAVLADSVAGTPSGNCVQSHTLWTGSTLGYKAFQISFRLRLWPGSPGTTVNGRWWSTSGAAGPSSWWVNYQTVMWETWAPGEQGYTGAMSGLRVITNPNSNDTLSYRIDMGYSSGGCFSVSNIVVERTPAGSGGAPGGGGELATAAPGSGGGGAPAPGTPSAGNCWVEDTDGWHLVPCSSSQPNSTLPPDFCTPGPGQEWPPEWGDALPCNYFATAAPATLPPQSAACPAVAVGLGTFTINTGRVDVSPPRCLVWVLGQASPGASNSVLRFTLSSGQVFQGEPDPFNTSTGFAGGDTNGEPNHSLGSSWAMPGGKASSSTGSGHTWLSIGGGTVDRDFSPGFTPYVVCEVQSGTATGCQATLTVTAISGPAAGGGVPGPTSPPAPTNPGGWTPGPGGGGGPTPDPSTGVPPGFPTLGPDTPGAGVGQPSIAPFHEVGVALDELGDEMQSRAPFSYADELMGAADPGGLAGGSLQWCFTVFGQTVCVDPYAVTNPIAGFRPVLVGLVFFILAWVLLRRMWSSVGANSGA